MDRPNDLEMNIQSLAELKVLNLDVTLSSLVKGGTLAGMDPWDVWCGNGWVLRRRGPVGPRAELDGLREVIRTEIDAAMARKG